MDRSHVIYSDFDDVNGVSGTVDALIGVLLIMVLVVGLAGNIAAAIYFWPRRLSTLPDLLYTIICVTDTLTSSVAILVIPALFNKRLPTLFRSFSLCGVFAILFNHLQRFSMFMVIMISITRTMAIFTPFRIIKRKGVFLACSSFLAFWAVIDGVFLGTGSLQVVYHRLMASCGVVPGRGAEMWTWNFYVALFMVWSVLGTVVIFISFVLCLLTVADKRRRETRCANKQKFMDVSVTITLFTAVFLICSLPLFAIQTRANIIYFIGSRDYEAENGAYGWYGLLIAHVFLTSLNAAANPCLYSFRIKNYRAWVQGQSSFLLRLGRKPASSAPSE